MKGQRPEQDISDRILDCKFAMKPVFKALAEAAEQSGWKGDEVATALVNLTDNRVLARIANAETDAQIKKAMR